jgi:molecular chaperone GrpE (heat shock protein)
MKRLSFFLAAILFIAAGTLSAYSAEKAHQATTSETAQQKEQYEKSMEERLGKLGKKLDELKAKTAAMGEQARNDMKGYLAEAEKKQKAASEKLESMRKKSVKKWKKFASDTDAAMDEFEKAFEKAKTHFKE